jgi:hypothetical protein
MRKLAALTLSLFLMTGTAFADSPKDTSKEGDAQPAASGAPKKAPAKTTAQLAKELDDLRQSLQAQQEQLQALKEELAKRDREIEDARKAAADANARASEAGSRATDAANGVSEVKSGQTSLNNSISDLKASNDVLKADVTKQIAEAEKKAESPAAIHFKGITLTPGGFIAAETVTRQRAAAASINTPFTGIPYPGNAISKVNESDFTARQSRLSLLAEGMYGSTKVTGYWEGDWLGTGVTSNNRQSNSYVFRQRILFAQAAFANGWMVTGGQQWSLATENKKGIFNRQETIPLTVDSQYVVGFTWARQYGFRVVKNFGDKFALGLAVEAPQATIGGRGFSTVTTTTVGTASTSVNTNTFLNGAGSGGGLLNFVDTAGYTFNKTPDFIFKAAADPGWGHYELFGIVSTFRNRVYPCGVVGTNENDTAPPAATTSVPCPIDNSLAPSAIGAFNDTKTGGGLGASLRVPVTSKLDFALKGVGGDGIGRYGSAQLADLTFRPDGTQALIRTGHGNAELEFHPTPKLDIYAYYGAELAWRAAYQGYDSITITKTPVIPGTGTGSTNITGATTTTTFKLNQIGGYGSPFANNSGCSSESAPSVSTLGGGTAGGVLTPSGGGTCAGDIRKISEFTLGFWHKLYQGPKGGLRWGIQYSYLTKVGWAGNNSSSGASTAAGVSPKAVDNMVWTSFRYYIP